MTKKVMKGVVVIIMAIMAIRVQVMMKADNPSFSYLSPNQAPSISRSFSAFPADYLPFFELY
jgi:hypothetical protein